MTMTAWTPEAWAEEVLEDANEEAPSAPEITIDANNVSDILHWMPAEEPVSDWYDRNNPLNASLGTSASDGTGSYPDLATGAYYTAAMIDQGNMAGIRAALASSDTPSGGFSAAVVASPWASSHYGGNPEDIAGTTPGGGAAPASAGSVGQVPTIDPSALAALDASTGGGATATDASYNANPFDLFGIPQTIAGDAASGLWSEIGPFIVKGMLVVAGLGIIVLGLAKTTDVSSKLEGAAKEAGPELAAAAAA